jgi:hypothetical protein
VLSAKGKQDKQWENNKLFGKRWIGCELVLSIYGTKDAVPAAFTYLILREK